MDYSLLCPFISTESVNQNIFDIIKLIYYFVHEFDFYTKFYPQMFKLALKF